MYTPEPTELMFREQRTHGKVWPGFQRPCPPTRVGRGHGLCALVRGGKAPCDWCQWVDRSAGTACCVRDAIRMNQLCISPILRWFAWTWFSLKVHLFMQTTKIQEFCVLLRWHTCLPFPPSRFCYGHNVSAAVSVSINRDKTEIKTYSVRTIEWTKQTRFHKVYILPVDGSRASFRNVLSF